MGSINDESPAAWNAAREQVLEREKVLKGKYFGHTEKEHDNVEHPAHYNSGKYETIDVIIDTLGEYEAISYCHGNVIKYMSRLWEKGKPIEDASKAKWYLNKMIELMEKTKGVNW